MTRLARRDLITCLVGAVICAGMGPARAQIHGVSDPAADAIGLLVACVLVVLALTMLAISFRRRDA